jgi:hypothetical protein
MDALFFSSLIWLFLAGGVCLFLAWQLKRRALTLLTRAFGGGAFGPALYALLTLPGFFVHEGAHFLAAVLLRVPVRGAAFIPRRTPDDLAVGAFVQVERRDPLRMAIIAAAPLVAGTVALGLLAGTLGTNGSDPRPWIRLGEWFSSLDWQGSRTWAQIYLIWSIGSHMAPSHADLRHLRSGALALLAILVLVGFLLPHLGESLPTRVGTALSHLGDGLALGAALAGIFLLPISLFTRLPRRL